MTAANTGILDTPAGDETGGMLGGTPALDASDWKNQIDEDLRGESSLADIKNVSDLAKRMVHAERMVGADKVVLPGKDATPEDLDAFYTKLGRPEKPDGYELPTENMPEGFAPDDARLTAMRDEAHRLGISSQQFAGMVRADANLMQQMQETYQTGLEDTRTESEKTMRREYGKAYEQNIQLAQDAIQRFGGEGASEVLNALNETGLGNDPRMVRFMVKVGQAIGQDEIIGGGSGMPRVLDPASALGEIDRLKVDKDFHEALMDKRNVGHQAAVEEKKRLFELAYPSDGA